jgi:hypothetical protein
MGVMWGRDDPKWALKAEEWGKESWRDDNNWIFEEQAGRLDRESGRTPGGPKVGGGCGTCLYLGLVLVSILMTFLLAGGIR